MNKIVVFMLALLPSSFSFAKCANSESTIFSCTTKKQKHVEVCDLGKTISYSFGKKNGKPELAINIPRDAASTNQWDGMGAVRSYSVNIPNGKTVYSVYWLYDRNADYIEGGINVETNGKSVANVICKADTVEQNLEGIKLKEAEY